METTIETAKHLSFATLQDAYNWACELINRGFQVQQSEICDDRFKSCRPRGRNARIFQLFGVTWGAEKKCKSIADGEWRVEVEKPGTTYYKGADIFLRECQTQYHRLSIWYSRFLPYAEAMTFCEQGWEQAGIDHSSINTLYKSVSGFWELGLGDGCECEKPDGESRYFRIDERDVDLFQDIYNASVDIRSPSLPFDESYQTCYVYTAMHKPKMILKANPDHYLNEHVRQVCEAIGKPVPAGF